MDGGCWFCSTAEGDMAFSWEFDCYLHLSCLKEALAESSPEALDEEAQIMGREFKLKEER